jgi:hypothetical protein
MHNNCGAVRIDGVIVPGGFVISFGRVGERWERQDIGAVLNDFEIKRGGRRCVSATAMSTHGMGRVHTTRKVLLIGKMLCHDFPWSWLTMLVD